MPPRPVVLDTNMLLVPFKFKVDIFAEMDYLMDFSHVYVISSKTVDELKNIGRIAGKVGMAARLALKMLEAREVKVVKNDLPVDDWIFEYAVANTAIVFTNDSELRRRLKAGKIKVGALKSRSKLGFV